jgi:mannose-1-phosphate guanylyltransferase / mannose-6-phosphate isomerase
MHASLLSGCFARHRRHPLVASARKEEPNQFVPLVGTSSTFRPVLDRVTRGLFALPIFVAIPSSASSSP